MAVWWLTVAVAAPLTWGDVTSEAAKAWARGPGVGWEALAQGATRASYVAGRPVTFSTMTRLGYAGQDEVQADIGLPLRIGGSPARAWRATAEVRASEAAMDRAAFVEKAQAIYIAWWEASEVEEHLRRWSEQVDADLARVQGAADAGLIASLEVDDLRAELAYVRAEVADARARAVAAEADLEVMLGPVELAPADDSHRLHEVSLDRPNPWRALDPATDPRIRAAEARQRESVAQARSASSFPIDLSLAGAGVSTGGAPAWVPMAGGTITAPLRAPGAAEARDWRARADADTADIAWLRARALGERDAEAASWDALMAQIRGVRDQVVEPLEVRLARLEAAWKAGLLPVDRVIRARRDHHEAEHGLLSVVARLLASEAKAEARAALATEVR